MVRDSIDFNSKKKQEPRVTEIYPLGLAADYVLATALVIPEKTYICAVVPDGDIPASTVNEYKACGCRYLRSEGLYCVEAKSALLKGTDLPIRRVTTTLDADEVNSGAGARQIFAEHLTTADSVCRLYAAFDGESPVGWVRSIRTGPETAYVSNLYVLEPYRKRGIGRALMSAMLNEDIKYGIQYSSLAASTAGSMLYPHLGYQRIGTLLLIAPPKPK